MKDWGIPSLLLNKLATVVPTCVYAGEPIAEPRSLSGKSVG